MLVIADATLYILYGESLMKYTEWCQNDNNARVLPKVSALLPMVSKLTPPEKLRGEPAKTKRRPCKPDGPATGPQHSQN